MPKSTPIKVYKVWWDWRAERFQLVSLDAVQGAKETRLLQSHPAFSFHVRLPNDSWLLHLTPEDAVKSAIKSERNAVEHHKKQREKATDNLERLYVLEDRLLEKGHKHS